MENEMNMMPRIGDPAPAFRAATTQGTINFPVDYSGRWIILFSHPADFTPVCTSEFMTFGKMQKEFEELNCQLVGLSVDGLSSHIAWLRTIRERMHFRDMDNIEVQFPLIDDVSMNVSRLYGMIQPGESETKAVRAVFFIDPKGIIRTIIYYPLALGRNFDEIKRVLIGLQTVDAFNVALPADWRPGDEVIDPNPGNMKGVEERWEKSQKADSGVKCYDWFFCTRKFPARKFNKKIANNPSAENGTPHGGT